MGVAAFLGRVTQHDAVAASVGTAGSPPWAVESNNTHAANDIDLHEQPCSPP
jgi:hypothetical protein